MILWQGINWTAEEIERTDCDENATVGLTEKIDSLEIKK